EIDQELKFGDEEIAEVVKNQEERLRTLYQDKIGEYELPERVEARHILIRTPPLASDDEMKAFRERIEAIRQRIVDGEDFVEVAKVESQDTGPPENRGEVNTFRRGENLPEFEEAVFNSTSGELSKVLETSVGLIIFYTEAILPAESHGYEDVSSELAQQALAEDAAAVEAGKLGAELLALIENGSNLEDAARGLELSIERTGLFSRRGDYHIPTLGKSEEMMDFVFAAKEGDITPITEINGGIFIAQIVERPSLTDESLEERLPQEKGRLLNAKRTEALTEWLQKERASLESQGQLVINQDMLGSGG
ncbi:MAG: peptidyl-prolyl cis-trans isomerase, partial [Deltaproteobacteria bacterium]|nr:peptidyl-prolyl cis-trans isomerase [Deltaproteobacteria bacterium]